MRNISEKIVRFIQRNHVWFVVAAILISAAAVPGITMLKMETGFSALIADDDIISIDTARYESTFGGEAINVLVTGNIDTVFFR